MRHWISFSLRVCCAWLVGCAIVTAEDWPQFRGVNASGAASINCRVPTEIGPDKNVAWKIPFPPGHSSPIVVGERLFLTAERDGKLLTVALNARDGKPLWEVIAPHQKLEEIHGIGSHAQSTPAADQECVVSFFGSCGLFCYDHLGRPLWHRPFGPFNNDFGAASSPILVGDWVILSQDHDTGSFLIALDKRTGKTVWQTDRSEFPRNYCTPVLWNNGGKKQLVVAATLRVVGYDLETGKEAWTVRGISRTVCSTPAVGSDGNLYVAGWAAGGDKETPIRVEPFEKVVARVDKNKNGRIDEDELDDGPIKMRFSQVDRDNDNSLTETEYEYFRQLFELGRNLVLAVRPGGEGEITDSHVLWRNDRAVPFCASPLFYEGRLFTVKDGGILASFDAKTGDIVKQGRLSATGSYYASPVAADGKVFLLSQNGGLTVISSEGKWNTLHSADFGEECYGTPAVVGDRIYVRTEGHLYCFERPKT